MASSDIDDQQDMLGFENFNLGDDDEDDPSAMSLVDHLEELRWRIFKSLIAIAVGSIVASFLARSVLIGAVNLNLQYGRLLSLGVKWLVTVLAVAMALEHLKIAPGIVDLAFGILFGGIVLTLVLAVGLNSKELVTKSFERDGKEAPSENIEEPFRHV